MTASGSDDRVRDPAPKVGPGFRFPDPTNPVPDPAPDRSSPGPDQHGRGPARVKAPLLSSSASQACLSVGQLISDERAVAVEPLVRPAACHRGPLFEQAARIRAAVELPSGPGDVLLRHPLVPEL